MAITNEVGRKVRERMDRCPHRMLKKDYQLRKQKVDAEEGKYMTE